MTPEESEKLKFALISTHVHAENIITLLTSLNYDDLEYLVENAPEAVVNNNSSEMLKATLNFYKAIKEIFNDGEDDFVNEEQ